MGRLILIYGENNSGKSRFAERLAAGFDEKPYYIATMRPVTAQNRERIEKHRIQREGMGFETLELPYDIASSRIKDGSVLLLEDVSNLLANNIFERNKASDAVLSQIMSLTESCRILIAVTISRFDYFGSDSETMRYIRELYSLNQRLFDCCSAAVSLKDTVATVTKGDINGIF